MLRLGRRSRLARRATLVAATSGAALLLLALPASAHVTVNADDATRGADDAILTFRVPNEEDTAVTTKIDIKFPTRNPIASVKPAPKQGWAVTTKNVTFRPPITTDDGTISQGVGEVTYTATSTANGIPAGDFESFQILVGPLPDAPNVAFPTVQTYSNGKSFAWIQPVTDPNNAPDNPAPVLNLVAASDAPASSAATPSASVSGAASAGPTVQAKAPDLSSYATASDASTAKVLGILGIVVAAVALLVAAIALTRSRRADEITAPEPEQARR